jgi:hypothetical protein
MADQPWFHTDLVRLQKAVLCANCELISEGLNGHCAACGSESLLRLSRVLGGAVEPELSFTFTSGPYQIGENPCLLPVAA